MELLAEEPEPIIENGQDGIRVIERVDQLNRPNVNADIGKEYKFNFMLEIY